MTYLQRINYRPSTDGFSDKELQYLQQHFDAYGAELLADGQPVRWEWIEEVEVVKAARPVGPTGWIVKNLVMGGERYHVGVYYGSQEAIFANATLRVAQYIVKTIAYYAAQRIHYKGPDDLTPLTEI
ncbi:MAG: hypothetical protein MUF87_08080 [Anaerolineae bacterium]|jgi:hypothetical protein|nr:hypothetical protein [Anaerolineae bacterium]